MHRKSHMRLYVAIVGFHLLGISVVHAQRATTVEWEFVDNGVFQPTGSNTIEFVDTSLFVVFKKPARLMEQVGFNRRYLKFTSKVPLITASTYVDIPGATGGRKLLMFGSGKNKRNRKLLLLEWSRLAGKKYNGDQPLVNLSKFYKKVLRTSRNQFNQVNVQGAAVVGNTLVLANAHKAGNSFILTNLDFYREQTAFTDNVADVRIRSFKAGDVLSGPVKICALTYVPQRKLLIYLAQEETKKGAISYLGWVTDFENKLNNLSIATDMVVPTGFMHPELKDVTMDNLAFKSMNGNLVTLIMSSDFKLYTINLDLTRQ